MIKVGGSGGLAPELPEGKRRVKDGGPVASSKGAAARGPEAAPTFSKAFLDATQAAVGRALDLVLDELSRQGEKLAASQNFEELEKYKGLVKEFLAKVSQGLAKLELTDGGSQGRSAKVHVILKKVDLEMEALAQQVLARQSTPISILARLDQIRGLLLDLYK